MENIRAHDRYSDQYEGMHGEIFNRLEQERIHRVIERLADLIDTAGEKKAALDFGCGTGNLTRHLLEHGLEAVCADVSNKFLKMARDRFDADVLKLNGRDLSNVESETFDLAAAYSVLHHIPDYLLAVRELARVTKPGGVVYIDHEHSESFWQDDPVYAEFIQKAAPIRAKSWKRFVRPINYYYAIKKILNPRFQPEGDIHVFSDDHIEWRKIANVLKDENFEIIESKDYLLYKKEYPLDVYEEYKGRCGDMHLLIAKKK